MKPAFSAISLTAALAISAFASAAGIPVKTSGDVLANPSGMTLYVFDQDISGKSACNGPCAALWPPVAAAADAAPAGEYSVVTRDDGSRQWAYKGKALYTWTKDQKPGDRTGDGVKGVWHVAKE